MKSTNTWLYHFRDVQKFLFTCGLNSSVEKILGQGIINFTSDCKVATSTFILPTSTTYVKSYRIFQPLTAPTTYIRNRENMTQLNVLEQFKMIKVSTMDHNKELLETAKQFDNLQQQFNKTEQERINKTEQEKINKLHRDIIYRNTIVGTSSISIFSLILIGVAVWIIYKNYCNRNEAGRKDKNLTSIQIVNSQIPQPPQPTFIERPHLRAPEPPKHNKHFKDDNY
jgi:hypothetical protein